MQEQHGRKEQIIIEEAIGRGKKRKRFRQIRFKESKNTERGSWKGR